MTDQTPIPQLNPTKQLKVNSMGNPVVSRPAPQHANTLGHDPTIDNDDNLLVQAKGHIKKLEETVKQHTETIAKQGKALLWHRKQLAAVANKPAEKKEPTQNLSKLPITIQMYTAEEAAANQKANIQEETGDFVASRPLLKPKIPVPTPASVAVDTSGSEEGPKDAA